MLGTMRTAGKLNGLFGYQAVVYAAGLLLATGLVADWGAWYSTSLPYRTQTEALLQGDLAVSRNVADLKFDHTWSEQGVHQVWGLGVPLWRLPFEAAAKLFGFDGFPDRLAFGLFALLVCFVVLKVWVRFGDGRSELGDRADTGNVPGGPPAVGGGASGPGLSNGADGWLLITGFGAGFLILLLFPPFLTLLQVRGAVWEEAVAYEYLYGILQLSLLLAFVRRPTVGRLLLVCTLAGFGGLIRPTLVFYGFATVVIATMVWVFRVGQVGNLSPDKERGFSTRSSGGGSWDGSVPSPPKDRLHPPAHRFGATRTGPTLTRVLAPALLGFFLFGVGGGVLWFTNLKRFGDGFEFGHKLNVQTLYGSMHATRFADPFQDEPLTGAAKELFGALFLAEKFNGADWYQENIFPGQSPTVRWREFYFRSYDWSYLPLLLLGWGAAVALWSRGARAPRPHRSAPSQDGLQGEAASIGDRNMVQRTIETPLTSPASEPGSAPPGPISDLPSSIPHSPPSIRDPLPLLTLGLWSLLAVIPLAGFYLYAPVISSRYMMDLAPAFAAAVAAAWLFLAARCTTRWSRVLVCLLLCAWLGAQLYLSRSVYGGPASVTAAELKVLRETRATRDGSSTNTFTADDYGQRLGGDRSGIPFDRTGWHADTGAVMPLVILFVKDAEFLELDFAPQPHPRIPPDPEAIRAKVGLEFLERERITEIDGGWRVRFRGPQHPRWRDGLQGAFIATVPKEFLAELTTPWILKSARWRDNVAEDATDPR